MADLERDRGIGSGSPQRIAVSGASGLVGSALVAFLSAGGHRVSVLVRGGGTGAAGEIPWDPDAGRIDATRLEGLDAVVHLAGESIAAGRWSPARKQRIRASRVDGTRLLAETLASLHDPPRVFLSASAVGFYGDRGDEPVDEDSDPGTGFLAEVCRQWELATGAASGCGIRVVVLRFGMVLSAAGGALARMLPAFRLGLGGPVGDGRQVLSWISHDDAIGAIHFALLRDTLAGAVNIVSPEPVNSRDFARALGGALRRPAVMPLPAFVVRALFGEMGRELLLSGCRVVPRRLQGAGFRFRHPHVKEALRFEIGRRSV